MSRIKAYMEYLAENDEIISQALIGVDIVQNPIYPDAVIQKNSPDEKDDIGNGYVS